MPQNALTVAVFAGALLSAPPEREVQRDGLLDHVRALPDARAAMGSPESRRGLLRAQRWLTQTLRDMGHDPRLQSIDFSPPESTTNGKVGDADADQREWKNIIVEISGREKPDEVILVGAHFDAAPGSPGADDNGSGVAAALELARALKDRPMRRTVRIVLFNLEELGMIGSRQYAQRVKERIDRGRERIVGMMSLEMIGYYSDEPGSQRSPIPPIPGVFDPPAVGDFLAIVATRSSSEFAHRLESLMNEAEPALKTFLFDLAPGNGWMIPDTRRSDHAPFWDIGSSAVMLTDTSEFRSPHYHQPSDTIETLDAERFTQAARAVVGAVWRLADPIEADDSSGESAPD